MKKEPVDYGSKLKALEDDEIGIFTDIHIYQMKDWKDDYYMFFSRLKCDNDIMGALFLVTFEQVKSMTTKLNDGFISDFDDDELYANLEWNVLDLAPNKIICNLKAHCGDLVTSVLGKQYVPLIVDEISNIRVGPYYDEPGLFD